MVGIVVGPGHQVQIVGHGLTVTSDFKLADGVTISAGTPMRQTSFGTTVGQLSEDAALIVMERLADFSLVVCEPQGGELLAAKAWNSLWTFSLLGLAIAAPVMPLYSYSQSAGFAIANRNLVFKPLPRAVAATPENLRWAADHYGDFAKLLSHNAFTSAQRYYNNAQYLPDDDARIMLLWAGIEGLVGVEAEITRRLALNTAILLQGSGDEKARIFAAVKAAYKLRSKVVHGGGGDAETLRRGYEFASDLLARLLRRVVELGRVPDVAEYDRVAVTGELELLERGGA